MSDVVQFLVNLPFTACNKASLAVVYLRWRGSFLNSNISLSDFDGALGEKRYLNLGSLRLFYLLIVS